MRYPALFVFLLCISIGIQASDGAVKGNLWWYQRAYHQIKTAITDSIKKRLGQQAANQLVNEQVDKIESAQDDFEKTIEYRLLNASTESIEEAEQYRCQVQEQYDALEKKRHRFVIRPPLPRINLGALVKQAGITLYKKDDFFFTPHNDTSLYRLIPKASQANILNACPVYWAPKESRYPADKIEGVRQQSVADYTKQMEAFITTIHYQVEAIQSAYKGIGNDCYQVAPKMVEPGAPQPVTTLTLQMLKQAHSQYEPISIYSRVDGVTRQLLAATYKIEAEQDEITGTNWALMQLLIFCGYANSEDDLMDTAKEKVKEAAREKIVTYFETMLTQDGQGAINRPSARQEAEHICNDIIESLKNAYYGLAKIFSVDPIALAPLECDPHRYLYAKKEGSQLVHITYEQAQKLATNKDLYYIPHPAILKPLSHAPNTIFNTPLYLQTKKGLIAPVPQEKVHEFLAEMNSILRTDSPLPAVLTPTHKLYTIDPTTQRLTSKYNVKDLLILDSKYAALQAILKKYNYSEIPLQSLAREHRTLVVKKEALSLKANESLPAYEITVTGKKLNNTIAPITFSIGSWHNYAGIGTSLIGSYLVHRIFSMMRFQFLQKKLITTALDLAPLLSATPPTLREKRHVGSYIKNEHTFVGYNIFATNALWLITTVSILTSMLESLRTKHLPRHDFASEHLFEQTRQRLSSLIDQATLYINDLGSAPAHLTPLINDVLTHIKQYGLVDIPLYPALELLATGGTRFIGDIIGAFIRPPKAGSLREFGEQFMGSIRMEQTEDGTSVKADYQYRPRWYGGKLFAIVHSILTSFFMLRSIDQTYTKQWARYVATRQADLKSLLDKYVQLGARKQKTVSVDDQLKRFIWHGMKPCGKSFLGTLLKPIAPAANFVNQAALVYKAYVIGQLKAYGLLCVPIAARAMSHHWTMLKTQSPTTAKTLIAAPFVLTGLGIGWYWWQQINMKKSHTRFMEKITIPTPSGEDHAHA